MVGGQKARRVCSAGQPFSRATRRGPWQRGHRKSQWVEHGRIMKILHIVKTSDGAGWAALEAAELTSLGVEVHVAVPATEGSSMRLWRDTKVEIHVAALDFPASRPWQLPPVCSRARALVESVKPDIIHTHHVGPTLLMRLALGKRHTTPRVFQVPGPLHLEHRLYRSWDLSCAGPRDFWIASSRCIKSLYLQA